MAWSTLYFLLIFILSKLSHISFYAEAIQITIKLILLKAFIYWGTKYI
jgi:hypothetical protein